MRAKRWLVLLAAVGGLVVWSALAATAQNGSGKGNDQVKLLPNTVELVGVTRGAEKCDGGKGTTVRLRVISDSPVDVRRYGSWGKAWVAKDFPNQKKGDEITDYFCTTGAQFKYYSRAAGSTDAWPKP